MSRWSKGMVMAALLMAVIGCGHDKTEEEKRIEKIKPFVDRGFNAFRLKDYDKAIKEWEQALAINSGLDYLYTNIGQAYYFLDQQDKALEYWLKYLEKNPKNAHIHNNLGSYYKDRKEFDQAIEYYKKAIEYHPSYILPYYNLGLIFNETGRISEAVAYIDKALQIAPEDYRLAMLRAKLYVSENKPDQAIAMYRRCIARVPQEPEARIYLAELLIKTGELEEAATEIETVSVQTPGFPLIDYVTALLDLTKKEHLEDIPQRIDNVAKANPPDMIKYWIVTIKAYLLMNKPQLALETIDRLLVGVAEGDKSTRSELAYLKGKAFAGLNNGTQAASEFNNALQMDPTTPNREAIQRHLADLNGASHEEG
ncbi:tetratricopeptide repeat protein [bacterium]|nr:tetratricopeptide repeat protein [candidate division CSSED10-310 bacterium]